MRASRLVLLLVGLAVALYFVKNHSGLFRSQDAAAGPVSPIDRARAVKDQADRKAAQTESTSREAESGAAPAAGVTENMTQDRVRALLGPPDEIETGTTENGRAQETWIYKRVSKTVVFENGIAISVR
ncbi:MAG: hypothetical protein ACRD00_08765 [Thermoanaerobaculia bacterium]